MTNEELQLAVVGLQNQIKDLNKKLGEILDLTYRQKLRLVNALQGSRAYFVSSSSGGAVTTQITFKDGILTLVASTSVSPSASPSTSPSISPSASPSASPS